MADNIKIDIDVESKSISSLTSDLKYLSKEIDSTTDTEKIKQLNKEFESTSKAIQDIEKETRTFSLQKVMEDTASGAETLTGSIGKMEDELRRLYHTGQENTEEFKRLQQATADMKSDVANLDREINLLGSNDSMQQFAGGLGNVGSSLKNLDFKTAAKDAGALAEMSKNMSFKTATDSLKNLGKTFMSLGKALLSNPLFIIAGIIAAIVAVIVKLMEEVGLLKVIMDALGEVFDWIMTPIDALIQGLKDLTDWFGWTNNAAKDSAEAQAEAMEKAAKSAEKNSNTMTQALDIEIAKMKARGVTTEEEFEKLEAMEARKLVILADTAKAHMKAADAALESARLTGDLSEEEMEKLQDNRDSAVLAYEKANAQIEINDIAASKRRQARIKAETDKIKAEAERETSDAKRELDARQAAWQKYQDSRLSAKRSTEDLIMQLNLATADSEDERLDVQIEQNKKTYQRLIEDTLSNENLLQSEKEAIISSYEKIREAKEQEYRDKKQAIIDAEKAKIEEEKIAEQAIIDEENALQLEKIAEQNDRIRELRQNEFENEIDSINAKYAEELKLAEGNATLIAELERKKAEEIKAVRREEAQLTKDLENQKRNAALDTTQAVLAAVIEAAGESSAIGKAAAIAGVTIDTVRGAMSAFNAMAGIPIVGPVLGGIAAASVGVMGAMNVQKIISTPIPGGGSGGGGGGSGPAIASAPPIPTEAPSVNLFGGGNDNTINSSDDGSIERGNQGGNQTVRAVVSWSDIDAVSKSDSNIQNEMQL